MNISATGLGKKYNRQWIFRELNLEGTNGELIAITGHNGSGKSTLLKILSGFIAPSKGKIAYKQPSDDIQLHFSFVAPYLNLMEEFTLLEHLQFHEKFKKPTISFEEMIEKSGLTNAKNKLVKDFSSGMKQRLRLILAFFFEASVVFLDEPTSNLDQSGVDWYLSLLTNRSQNQLFFVASNQPNEYHGANQIISIENYQKKPQ